MSRDELVHDIRVLATPERLAKLHPVEVLMIQEVIDPAWQVSCTDCVRWLLRLREKLKEVDCGQQADSRK